MDYFHGLAPLRVNERPEKTFKPKEDPFSYLTGIFQSLYGIAATVTSSDYCFSVSWYYTVTTNGTVGTTVTNYGMCHLSNLYVL